MRLLTNTTEFGVCQGNVSQRLPPPPPLLLLTVEDRHSAGFPSIDEVINSFPQKRRILWACILRP